jgi:hypothetical protein
MAPHPAQSYPQILSKTQKYYPFKNGIPSEDTFRYVFMALDPKAFGKCFADWMRFLHAHVKGLVAIDGKCCRGSSKGNGLSPVNIVNAFCHEHGVVLAAIDRHGHQRQDHFAGRKIHFRRREEERGARVGRMLQKPRSRRSVCRQVIEARQT